MNKQNYLNIQSQLKKKLKIAKVKSGMRKIEFHLKVR